MELDAACWWFLRDDMTKRSAFPAGEDYSNLWVDGFSVDDADTHADHAFRRVAGGKFIPETLLVRYY